VRLFSLKRGGANLVEITLPEGASASGKTVGEITFPTGTSLATIVRDGHVIAPKDQDLLMSGDELIFVATTASENSLKECLLGR
jgi:trk system potassium uptake protein TrkA